MKSMLIKHIFIKIKANYKRFLSLLSMALLGVGFYSGIQACSPDMLKTLDNFYDNNNNMFIMQYEFLFTMYKKKWHFVMEYRNFKECSI